MVRFLNHTRLKKESKWKVENWLDNSNMSKFIQKNGCDTKQLFVVMSCITANNSSLLQENLIFIKTKHTLSGFIANSQ